MKIAAFTDDKGKTDWWALKSCEVECGDRCSECGIFMCSENVGHRQKCIDCGGGDLYANDKPVEHAYFIRCPVRRRLTDVEDVFLISPPLHFNYHFTQWNSIDSAYSPSKLRSYCEYYGNSCNCILEADGFFTSPPVDAIAYKAYLATKRRDEHIE